MFTKSRGSTTSSLTSALHNTRVGLLLSPFGSFSPGRLQRISSVPLSDVFLASRSNTRMRLSTSAGSHGHKLELRNQLFSERRTKTHKFGTWSVLLFFFFFLPRRVFKAPSMLPLRRKSSVAMVTRKQRDAPSSFPNKPFSVG